MATETTLNTETTFEDLSAAQQWALTEFAQIGGHGYGARIKKSTAHALRRMGLVTLGHRPIGNGGSIPYGEATQAGREILESHEQARGAKWPPPTKDDRYIYRAVLSQEGELPRMIHFNRLVEIERDLPVARDEVMDALRALDRIADADGMRITVHVGPISITITAGACTL